MQPPRFKGDFLGRLLLLLVVAFGMTIILQARALRADAAPVRCVESAWANTPVLGSTKFAQRKVQGCPQNSRSGSSGSAT